VGFGCNDDCGGTGKERPSYKGAQFINEKCVIRKELNGMGPAIWLPPGQQWLTAVCLS